MRVRSFVRLALGAAALVLPAACGTDAVGIDPCRQIEEARCQQAPACGITLQPPYSNTGGDVNACIRFYDDACLHGLEVASPGASAVNACVQAIQHSCMTVTTPQSDPACAWLVPPQPAPVTDASDDGADSADSADSATE